MAGVNLEDLRRVALFKDLTDAELEAALQAAQPRKVEENGFLFMQDDPAERVYVLRSGRVKLGQLTPDGQQIILNLLGPWQMFGIIGMVPHATYPVSAQAASDCQALSWDQAALNRLAEKVPGIALRAMGLMAGHVQDFQGRIRELTTERVERRIARVLLRLANQVGRKTEEGVLIDLAVTRQDIAEMGGTTLYTVSRTLSQWERKGLIDAGREKVIIRRPHELVLIAEDLIPPENPEKI